MRVRPAVSQALRSAKKRADRELAHLTADRVAGVRPQKAWLVPPLERDLRTLLEAFLAAADANRLDQSVSVLLAQPDV